MRQQKKKMLVLGVVRKSTLMVIRELHEAGFHVTAGNDKRICLGFFTRHTDRRILTPSPDHPDLYIEFLLDEVKRNKYEMVFCATQRITNLLSQYKDELSKHTRLLVPDFDNIKRAGNKVDTIKAALEAGVSVPRTYFPTIETIDGIASEIEYPVLVKPAVSAGARGITIVSKSEELPHKFRLVEKEFGQSFVQEYVPQPHDQYKADILFDNDSQLVAEIVYKKHRFYPADGGSSVLCSSVDRPDIIEQARTLLQHMNWTGFADFDFIVDPRTDSILLVEINPRFPESYGIARTSGIHFSLLMYRIACGEKIDPVRNYELGKYFRFFPGDMLWFLTSPDRFKSNPSFFDFFNSDVQYQILSLRDPGPVLAYIIENVTMMLNAQTRRSRFKLKKTE